VHLTIDYVKPAEQGFDERECATVVNGTQNISEALVSKGLAFVVRHKKDDDNRASNYDDLLIAEDRAQKAQKGLHSSKEPPATRPPNDASESAAKAKQFLPFLQRSGTISGVVEYAASGSRFKVWIPSQNAKITFVLAGIRTPKTARNASETSEPFGDESSAFANRRALQRDVEIVVETVDKVGGFIGTLFLPNANGPRQNYSVALLEAGLASIHDYSASQSTYAKDLYAAEKIAQDKRIGIWSIRDPLAEALAKEATVSAGDDEGKVEETLEVYVSEIGNAGSFYVQVAGSGTKAFYNEIFLIILISCISSRFDPS
jgi:staphylococcal nuclease domain-containing protein 1